MKYQMYSNCSFGQYYDDCFMGCQAYHTFCINKTKKGCNCQNGTNTTNIITNNTNTTNTNTTNNTISPNPPIAIAVNTNSAPYGYD
jgi:hypothetical protein